MGGSSSKKKHSLICVGLDNSGKSTIINYLKPPKEKSAGTAPTVGLSSESFKYDGVQFTCLDMAGGKQYRNMWKDHYNGVEGIMFVVDSEDTGRLCVAEDELLEMLDAAPKNCPILFFANKQDLPKALSAQEIDEKMNLSKHLGNRAYRIQASMALKGTGLDEGMKWLASQLPDGKDK